MNTDIIAALAARAKQYSGRNLNEAQTKTALIQPFIEALGYEVSNPFEVVAEYTADEGIKRGEKIDFAIVHDNSPLILIECKPVGKPLSEGHCSQLRRYFQSAPTAKIGILTDGIRYLFFSDRQRENLMDDKPFMEIDFLNFNERFLPELQKLSKNGFDIEGIKQSADTLRYFREILRNISQEMDNPSDEVIKLFVGRVYKKRLNTKHMNFLAPIFKQALDAFMDDKINARLENSKTKPKSVNVAPSTSSEIITTNTETWGLLVVRTLLRQTVDPARIWMRDNKSYCAILLDDNNRKTICRFYSFAEWKEGDPNIGEGAHVRIFTGKHDGERFPLRFIDDLYPLKEELIKAARQYK